MNSFAKFVCPAVFTAILAGAAPAHAQFGGSMDMNQMQQQFTPMLEMMKRKMGKKRFGQLMQTMGPMMSQMMDGQAGGFGAGGFGSSGFGMGNGGFDMGQIMTMVGSMKGLTGGSRRGKARRHHG